MIGRYAKRASRRMNSCANSASMSFSRTPAFVKCSTRRNPASVMSQACRITATSGSDFHEPQLVHQWREAAVVVQRIAAHGFGNKAGVPARGFDDGAVVFVAVQ